MKKEVIAHGKIVEEAVLSGAQTLGVSRETVSYEVLAEPKKGLFGIGAAPAEVRVTYEETPADIALAFVKTLIADMELDAEVSVSMEKEGEGVVTVKGENAGVLIGHHGDTLDALQYLENLAANHGEERKRGYVKFTLDIENYRAKREETLKQLADRMAAKVLKYRKSITLEPMNPYERRIIHSRIQDIEGVSTTSVGYDDNRKIVIFLTDSDPTAKGAENGEGEKPRQGRGKSGRGERGERGERKSGSQKSGKGGKAPRSEEKSEKADKADKQEPVSAKPEKADTAEKSVRPEKAEKSEKAEKAEAVKTESSSKPYYMRPKNAPSYQKPVKKASVESYYFDLENSKSGLRREKEETTEIAKACGIYDDPLPEESTSAAESAEKTEKNED